MWKVFYTVRVMEDGKLVERKRFAAKDLAVNWAADKLVRRRRVKLARDRKFILEVFSNDSWGITAKGPQGPWQTTAGPYKEVFLHTAVTQQLPVSATVEQEKARMRLLDQIARSRGFNGISYSWVIFPSGRIYEGRGNFVVEAATEGHNSTSDSICFDGNGDLVALNDIQKMVVKRFIDRLQNQGVYVKTGLDVRGHREVSTQGKSCPGTKVTNADIQAIQAAVNA